MCLCSRLCSFLQSKSYAIQSMAKLVSYKAKDDGRYSMFGNDMFCNSNENLTESRHFRLVPKKKKQQPVTKGIAGTKASQQLPASSPTTESQTKTSSNIVRSKLRRNITKNSSNGAQGGRRSSNDSQLALYTGMCKPISGLNQTLAKQVN